MSEQYIGQIEAFAFKFPPRGWAQCNGQLLSIQQNQALFALLGTAFGGNGTTTFGLPDLRGRLAVSQGSSPSGQRYVMGEMVGSETVSLLVNEMPAHNHTMNAVNNGTSGSQSVPSGSVQPGSGVAKENEANPTPLYAAASGPQVVLENLGPAGGSQPHTNMMPYLPINYCIALTGIFPSRG